MSHPRDDEPLAGAIGALDLGRAGRRLPRADSKAEEAYWRENFYSRRYVRPGDRWAEFGPAFRMGWQARRRFPLRKWSEVERSLEREWRESDPGSRLPWGVAKRAARDAWDHLTTWFDDRAEESYWQQRFTTRGRSRDYDAYRAAFRFGWEAKRRHVDLTWEQAEEAVEREWRELDLDRRLDWARARTAVRDAWLRVEGMLPDRGD